MKISKKRVIEAAKHCKLEFKDNSGSYGDLDVRYDDGRLFCWYTPSNGEFNLSNMKTIEDCKLAKKFLTHMCKK